MFVLSYSDKRFKIFEHGYFIRILNKFVAVIFKQVQFRVFVILANFIGINFLVFINNPSPSNNTVRYVFTSFRQHGVSFRQFCYFCVAQFNGFSRAMVNNAAPADIRNLLNRNCYRSDS